MALILKIPAHPCAIIVIGTVLFKKGCIMSQYFKTSFLSIQKFFLYMPVV